MIRKHQQYRITFGHVKLGQRARKLIADSLDRNWVSIGPNVELFEKLFAEKFGFKEAVAVSSGTDACLAALLALRDEQKWNKANRLIVPALCFPAPINAARAAGFAVKFVDIRRETLNLDPEKVCLSGDTLALLAVHTMGRPCDLNRFYERDWRVIEDCCESYGAVHRQFDGSGIPVGHRAKAAAFSFYAAHMICSGEGGMSCTSDPEFAKLLRSVRSHGRPHDSTEFDFQRPGLNLKMNDLEAAVGIEGLEEFDGAFARRREVLLRFRRQLSPLRDYFYLFDDDGEDLIAPHAVPLVIREDVPKGITRDGLRRRLEESGVQTKTLFGSLPTQHAAFADCGHKLGDFPEAEFVGRNGLHFGCHQYMTDADVDYVCDVIEGFVKENR